MNRKYKRIKEKDMKFHLEKGKISFHRLLYGMKLVNNEAPTTITVLTSSNQCLFRIDKCSFTPRRGAKAYTNFMFFWSYTMLGHNNFKHCTGLITVCFQLRIFWNEVWEGNFPNEFPRRAVLWSWIC
jgi:hypothetical protein